MDGEAREEGGARPGLVGVRVAWSEFILTPANADPAHMPDYVALDWADATSVLGAALAGDDPFFWAGVRTWFIAEHLCPGATGEWSPEDEDALSTWLFAGMEPGDSRLSVWQRRPAAPVPIPPSPFDLPLDEPPPPLHDFEIEVLDQHGAGYAGVSLAVVDSEQGERSLPLGEHGYAALTSMQPGSCKACVAESEPEEPLEPEQVAVVSVTFQDGQPAAGAAFTLTPEGGEPVIGTLDESGCVLAEWVGGSTCTVALPELRTTTTELIEGVSVQAGQPAALVAERPALCHRLTGFLFDTDKSFLLPGAIEAMAAVRASYERYSGYDIEIVGHTDTTGGPGYNQTLSEERAKAMAAFLTDDADAWVTWYGDDKPEAKRWGDREDLLMLAALPDASSRGDDEHPVSWYQRARGLPETGKADAAMRKQLIAEYMAADGTTLPEGVAIKTTGKGESEPLVDSGDGQDVPENRRVEVIFCPPGKPAPEIPKKKKPKPKPEDPDIEERDVPKPKTEGGLRTLRLIDSQGDNSSQQREVLQDGTLEVVPPQGQPRSRIEVLTEVDGPHTVKWEVMGGAERVAGADAFTVTGPSTPGWNPKARPTEYSVIAEALDVNALQVQVHAYPNDRYEVGHNFDDPAVWKKVVEAIEKVLELAGNEVKIKKPRGNWKLQAAWREAESDPRAFYWFGLTAQLDPMIGFDGVEISLGPDKIMKWVRKIAKRIPGKLGKKIEQFIKKAVQANGYVKLDGDIALDVDMERTGPEQAIEAVTNHGKGVTGSPKLSLGLQARIGDDPDDDDDKPIVVLDIAAQGHLFFDCQPFVDEKGWGVECAVRLGEVKAVGEVKLWRILEPEPIEVPLFEASEKAVYGPAKLYIKEL